MKLSTTITAAVVLAILLVLVLLFTTQDKRNKHHILNDVHLLTNYEYESDNMESDAPFYRYDTEEIAFSDVESFQYTFKAYPECRKYPRVQEYPNATCLGRCTTDCDEGVISDEIKAHRAELVCTAKVFLIGFHKCGSSDISEWFRQHPDVYWRVGDMFYDPAVQRLIIGQCPIDLLKRPDLAFHTSAEWYLRERSQKVIYQDCPGCLRIGQVLKNAETGLFEVMKPAIFLENIYTEDQRFIVSIRNPTDRFISEYFYKHKKHIMFPNLTKEQVGYDKLHFQVDVGVSFLNECLTKIGAVVCAQQFFHKRAPNVASIHSLAGGWYSTFLKDFFKYIPRDQVVFNQLEEYAKDQASSMKRVFQFVGLTTFPVDEIMKKKTLINGGYKTKPVYKETRTILVNFYKPFNEELAELLNDPKWLYLEPEEAE